MLFYLYKLQKTNRIVLLLPVFYNFIVLYVILGTFFFTYAIEEPFDLYNEISNDSIYKSAFIFMLSSFFFYLGTMAAKSNSHIVNGADVNIKYQKTLIILILMVYFLYVFGYGIEGLIYRDDYIDYSFERNRIILIFFYVASPFVTVLIPFIKNRVVKYFIFLFCLLVLFSSSARFVVIVPFLYTIGTFLKYQKISFSVLVVNVFLVFILLIFILQIRYYPHHGLIPNLNSLFTKGIDIKYLFEGLNYAFSFSLFGVSYVLNNFTHDSVAFLTSLNPLPSIFLDIQYMSEIQTMKPTAPMSAVSILTLAGYPVLISFYLVTGYVFSTILNRMQGSTFLYYPVVGLFVLFTLLSIQYNLRGLSRFFYYSILIFILYLAFRKIKIKI
jgi:hypothetical protein